MESTRRNRAAAPHAVAIVGAGFSGTMVAIRLRRLLPAEQGICLLERTGRFARGPAYAETDLPLLLNVRAGNMSAFPEEPAQFEAWLHTHPAAREVETSPAGRFATRRLYGRYLRALLYAEMKQSGGSVTLCADEVTRIARTGEGWVLHCSGGHRIAARAVVLALGTLPARDDGQGPVFRDPWGPATLAGLRPLEAVLIVGSGLTMVDLVLTMRASGFRGPIIAVSRRGLAPQRHGPPAAWTLGAPPGGGSLVALLRWVRAEVRRAAAQGVDWRGVIDALRPVTVSLWQDLPRAERARFLRHLRPFWDVHRHRLAPGPADAFAALHEGGRLRLLRGRLAALEAVPGGARVRLHLRNADAPEEVVVQRVILATGLGAGMVESPLVTQMRADGLARTDANGLGLEVDDALHVLGAGGAPTPGLWALGPIVRGVFWECTAVPDIRAQARAVAEAVRRTVAP